MWVSGTVDGEPLKAVIHYLHSKQLKVQVLYHSEDYLSLFLLTELQDFLTGTMTVSASDFMYCTSERAICIHPSLPWPRFTRIYSLFLILFNTIHQELTNILFRHYCY